MSNQLEEVFTVKTSLNGAESRTLSPARQPGIPWREAPCQRWIIIPLNAAGV